MKRILLPTDFSKTAKSALRYAAHLAKKYNAEIIAMYMIDRTDAFLSRKEAMDLYENINYHERIEESFKEFLDHEYLKGITVNTEIRREVNFTHMQEVTKDLGADVIVMGSKGAHGLEGFFVGSNTEKVVRTSEVPVIVVKESMPGVKLDKVVLTCDLNLDMTAAFKKAYDFLKDNSIDFDLVYINTPEDFLNNRAMEFEVNKFFEHMGMEESELKDKVVFYNDFNIEAGIFSYADKVNADLIVLPTHGRKGLAHLIYQSYGEKMANHSEIPVMTVRA